MTQLLPCTESLPQSVGIGLRPLHYSYILEHLPAVAWMEATSENFMGIGDSRGQGSRPLRILERIRRDRPIALHGVSLSIASTDPVRHDYLERLKWLVDRVEPAVISDHLCWTGVGGTNLHDLLPVPLTEEAIRHVVPRISEAQERLGRRMLFENVSSYLEFECSEMPEWEFLAEVARRSGCGILLDVNNVYVSAMNHGFDPMAYLLGIPRSVVGQMHLAGHTEAGGILVDTHDRPVRDEVWSLYESAVGLFGPVPTLLEWDASIPSFPELETEAAKAGAIMGRAIGAHACAS